MQHQRIDELKQQLLADGYSIKYVNRLCAELRDHCLAMREEHGDVHSETSIARIVLGSQEDVRIALSQRAELMPIRERFPVSFFVLLPGLLVCTAVIVAMLTGSWVASTDTPVSSREVVIQLFPFFSPIVILIGTSGISFFADGCRHKLLIAATCATFSLLGLLHFDLVECTTSGGVLFRSCWQPSWLCLCCPWVVSIVVSRSMRVHVLLHFLRRLSGVHSAPNLAHRAGVRTISRAACCSLLIVFVLVGSSFVAIVGLSRAAFANHPVDQLVDKYRHLVHLESIKLRLLGDIEIQDELALSANQKTRVETILSVHIEEVREREAIWREADPSRRLRAFSAEHHADITHRSICDVARILDESQLDSLTQFALQTLGTRVLFIPEVQSELRLSASQLRDIKDEYKQFTINKARIRIRAIKEPATVRDSATDFDKLVDRHEAIIFDLLSERQRSQLSTRLGCELHLGGNFYTRLTRPSLIDHPSDSKDAMHTSRP